MSGPACNRLFTPHQWTPWKDVTEALPIGRGDGESVWGAVIRQERRCELCNKLEMR